MTHLPVIISDLALILVVASAVTLLFKRLKQPVVLGYIVAGALVGPNIKWMPSVDDTHGVQVWADIGVIFLLFGLGLEFSFRKLAQVGHSAAITAAVEVVGMVALGVATGMLFGWSRMDSLFLGGILAISSTTIIIRAFDELGMKARGFISLVIGVLIVEDLFAILLMVLLSSLAVSNAFSGVEMAISAAKLVFFLALWFVSGIFLIPTFLRRSRQYMNEETMLVVSIGLCFLMVVLATKAGFSAALGAFIMGSILSETTEGKRIEHIVQPVKDLFAAVFFVSVGMLINPTILRDNILAILVITLVTIIGKLLTTSLGALLSGRSLRHSIQTGMSLSQIGEFSFIIAGLGLSLKVTSDFLYPVAIGVSALTTFTTPYMMRSADWMVQKIERILPKSWLNFLEQIQGESNVPTATTAWRSLLKGLLIRNATNTVVIAAIFFAVKLYLHPFLHSYFENPVLADWCALFVDILFSAPFLWAIAFRPLKGTAYADSPSVQRATIIILRWAVTAAFIGFMAAQYVSLGEALILVGCVFALLGVNGYRRLGEIYGQLERRFVTNLREKDLSGKSQGLPPLAPWDAYLQELQLAPDSPLVGQTLAQAMIRERFGVTIALIQRGGSALAAPNRNTPLYPFDKLHVIGTEAQIAAFKARCEGEKVIDADLSQLNYVLKPMVINAQSAYAEKTILNCGLREATQGLVVGIEKQGQRHLNPDSSTRIELGDVLWVVGNRDLMKW